LGIQVALKREDLTDLALGGDKPRKLEYELVRAREAGADTIVTCGSAQSNHARLTAAAARTLGLDCTVVLSRDAYTTLQGNLLTVYLLGAEVRLVDASDHWALDEHALAACEALRSRGRTPYYVPVSGTTERSVLGYVRAGLELADQFAALGISPAAVYVPFGTGGILAGLLYALRARGVASVLVGISVNREQARCEENLHTWWAALSSALGDRGAPDSYEIHDRFIGRGYGDPTEACLDAILTFGRSEGILLDPVYSGKVAAGLLAHHAEGRWGRGQSIVMLHSGGVPALFAYHAAIADHLRRRGVELPEEGPA
ncbi:MAG: 1-aminocyclopropane-1-carboxylate deaminase/D-cysteine desulfhydrase, partial [Chloroflexota bacterium]